MTSIPLIRKLSDGYFHSGSELGEFLGVSRAAVWKQIQKLETDYGVKCDSVKGKGYQIRGGLDLLNEEIIHLALSHKAQTLLSNLDVHTVVDSTNDIALEKAKQGVESGYVCIAEKQNKGRGRRGGTWVSPFGKNIYMSILWRFQGGAAALEGLSLATGVAVAGALSKVGVNGVNLKWPNDILHERRKLAGILLEMSGDAAGVCEVVLGVGLNIGMLRDEGKTIDQSWIDLQSLREKKLDRNLVVATLLNELLLMLEEFSLRGFVPFMDEWSRLDSYRGKEVTLTTSKSSEHGIAMGVDQNGALKLKIDEQVKVFSGGEVSLRLKR